MDVLIKARELGETIRDSAQMQRLKKAEASLGIDERGMALMEDYRMLQIGMVKAAREKKDEAKIRDIKETLMAKQKELNDYPVTLEFLDAKNDFDEMIKNMNDIIKFAITGEECSPSKCSSCSGCGSSHA